jgi:hypothetical protein
MKMDPGRSGFAAAAFLSVLVGLAAASPTEAGILSGHRPHWAVGAGWNFGRGTFEGPNAGQQEYREGSAAQIRAGRMLGNHLQVGVDYQGWAIEGGASVEDSTTTKFRRSLQNLSASLTLFPGKPRSAWGGWYIRGGLGLGWAGTGAKEVHIGSETHDGVRKDEWGWAFLAETGYEFWVLDHFSIAPGLALNYFQIGGTDFVDRATVGVAQISFTAYFGGGE